MKLKTYLAAAAVLLLITAGCKDKGTNPPVEEKPPGYQEDIPWPSLADSPWPMFKGNPQYNGRSEVTGPLTGTIEWQIDSLYIESGIVLGLDSAIYFETAGNQFRIAGLNSINYNGKQNWAYSTNVIANATTPLVTNDGLIIGSDYYKGKVFALDENGNVQWEYNTNSYILNRGINIGRDGTIFFVDSTWTLFALSKNGSLKWKLKIENSEPYTQVGTPISPDGSTIYISTTLNDLVAIDINSQTIKWTYKDNFYNTSPIIDAQGNIYLLGYPQYGNKFDKSRLAKINSDGSLLWEYEFGRGEGLYYYEPAIDKMGNIYFGYDTLYSLTYNGTLRWKTALTGAIMSPIIIDANNIIYTLTDIIPGITCELSATNSDGHVIWQSSLLEGYSGDCMAIAKGVIYCPTYRSKKLYKIK